MSGLIAEEFIASQFAGKVRLGACGGPACGGPSSQILWFLVLSVRRAELANFVVPGSGGTFSADYWHLMCRVSHSPKARFWSDEIAQKMAQKL